VELPDGRVTVWCLREELGFLKSHAPNRRQRDRKIPQEQCRKDFTHPSQSRDSTPRMGLQTALF
jgi:hypothetical protein